MIEESALLRHEIKQFDIKRFDHRQRLDVHRLNMDAMARQTFKRIVEQAERDVKQAIKDAGYVWLNEPTVDLMLYLEMDAVDAESGLEDGTQVADPRYVLVYKPKETDG